MRPGARHARGRRLHRRPGRLRCRTAGSDAVMWPDMMTPWAPAPPDPLRVTILGAFAYAALDLRERINGDCGECRDGELCPDHDQADALASQIENAYMQARHRQRRLVRPRRQADLGDELNDRPRRLPARRDRPVPGRDRHDPRIRQGPRRPGAPVHRGRPQGRHRLRRHPRHQRREIPLAARGAEAAAVVPPRMQLRPRRSGTRRRRAASTASPTAPKSAGASGRQPPSSSPPAKAPPTTTSPSSINPKSR